jgi:hypothetical protein
LQTLWLPGKAGKPVTSKKAELVDGFQGRNGNPFRKTMDRIKPPTALQGAFGPCVANTKSRSASMSEAKPGFGVVSTAFATGPKATQHAPPCESPAWLASCAALFRSAVASFPTSAHPNSANNGINAYGTKHRFRIA